MASSSSSGAAETAPLTSMASAIFFGSILFASVALTIKAITGGGAGGGDNWRLLQQTVQNPRSSALEWQSFYSIYTFLVHLVKLGGILFYAYLCEYHPPYPHGQKSYDRDEFFFYTALLFVASAFTLKSHRPAPAVAKQKVVSRLPSAPNSANLSGSVIHGGPSEKDHVSVDDDEIDQDDDAQKKRKYATLQHSNSFWKERPVAPPDDATEVMNRDQTEEWKGWMQFMFLLYHYYHAEEVYNAIRIMITCYVFLTGYGNVSFFYLKRDYSAVRVIQMLWRLNFLVLFLCLTQGTTYILYYICLLHTYFFLMVYVTMSIGAKRLNYSKYGIRYKFLALACIIFVIWDLDSGIFKLMHGLFLGDTPILGATSGTMWEWYFRSTLDHWSTFLGMLFALNFPITSLFFRKLEAQQPAVRVVIGKGAMAVAFCAATYWWIMNPFQHAKYDYNQTNAYWGWIPLISYIYLRNMTTWLRGHTLEMLHQIGKTTLETYLMQHHIWLTSNAKSLLILIPGWPKMNFLLVSMVYFVLSRQLYKLTLYLRGMVLPNDLSACMRNSAVLFGALLFCIVLAHVLHMLEMLNLSTIAVCCVVLGHFLYRTVVQYTWSSSMTATTGFSAESLLSVASSKNGGTSSNSSRTKEKKGLSSKPSWLESYLPGLAAALMVFLVGACWHTMARIGAGKIIPLPATCESYVQEGAWIPVDTCNEESRALSYRDYGMGSLGTCAQVPHPQTQMFVWGWEAAPPDSHCRIMSRDTKSLLKTLRHRNVTFVGDSIVRHLYHAACRQLGDVSAGAYNTSMTKWADFSKSYKDTAMEFRWAPLSGHLIDKFQEIQKEEDNPDLVVVGGGAWDRLHNCSNREEEAILRSTVEVLAQEIRNLEKTGVPVVWVVPTTINTWALGTEQKRNQIREDQMVALRSMYERQGVIEAASFVLDGPTFTADRVTESYDGVHYPLDVYDAGAQILANTYDWLLHPIDEDDSLWFTPPRPGRMANPALGVMMIGLVCASLFMFDGFFGVSYLAGLFAPAVIPLRLYLEAFVSLHQRMGLPAVDGAVGAGAGESSDWVPIDHGGGGGGGSAVMVDLSFKSKSSDHAGDHGADSNDENNETQSFVGSIHSTSVRSLGQRSADRDSDVRAV